MHNLYSAEIYRPGTIILLLTVWVYLHLYLHSKLWKKLYSYAVVKMHDPMIISFDALSGKGDAAEG